MALSRPAPADAAAVNLPTATLPSDYPLDESISTAQTHDDPGDAAIASRLPAISGDALKTSGGDPPPPSLTRRNFQLSDDVSHDAATLAAEEVASSADQPPAATRTRGLAGRATQADDSLLPASPLTPARFTTVAEEEARREAVHERAWPLMAAQVAAFVLVGAGLVGLFMYLSRPSSADELYREINGQASADSGSLSAVDGRLQEFFQRFPDDPRTAELRDLEHQLELDRAQRRLQLTSRGGAFAGGPLLTVEQLYLQGIAAGQESPAAGIRTLNSLVALYSVLPTAAVDSAREADARERQRVCVELAKRQLQTFRSELAEATKQQLATLHERLATAGRLMQSDRPQALMMYRAIIDLYKDQTWAGDVVAEAQRQLSDAGD